MTINTVIFDFDGTLLDTLEDLQDSINFALMQSGYESRSLAEIRNFVGNGIWRLMELALPKGANKSEVEAHLNMFRSHYAGNMQNKTRPYDGIYPLLKELKRRGISMAIVSNKHEQAVKTLCSDLFGEYIQVAIGEGNGISRKPAADGLLEALKQLGAKKENAIYVGDTEVDLQTARNAGIAFVGVSWGFRDRVFLMEQGANDMIDTPWELLEIIK